MSGPGPVTIADPKAAVTTASFSAPGDYVLRVVADNGTSKVTSTLAVKVELPAPRAALPRRHQAPLGHRPLLGVAHQGAHHVLDSALHRADRTHGHPPRARRRRHRQLRRGRQGPARRAARRAQGLRVLERVGAPDRRVDLPGADGGSTGRPGNHRGAEEAARDPRGLGPEESWRLSIPTATCRPPSRCATWPCRPGHPRVAAARGRAAGRPFSAGTTRAMSPATSSSRLSTTTR